MALLSLRDVKRHYVGKVATVKALDGVTLDIHEGEVVSLLGPSGSGKTTMLNIVSALDSPTEGEYLFNGETVPQAPEEVVRKRVSVPTPHPAIRPLTWIPEFVANLLLSIAFSPANFIKARKRAKQLEAMTRFRRENVGYVFQFFNLLGDLTVMENVMLAQEIHGGRDREKAARVLELVGLGGLENRFPSELSGGQQQRVAIARSLAKGPKLLLGDEPTGNLDSETTAQVMKVLVNACRRERITAIIVTHDLALTKYATRIINIDSGKIVSDTPGGRAALHSSLDAAEAIAEATAKGVGKAAEVVSTALVGAVSKIIEATDKDAEDDD